MSKKRKRRKKRSRSHDIHRFEALLERDDEVDGDSFESRLPRGSRRFDFERWRDDLVARDLQRQRMRMRELKRGDLRPFEIPSTDERIDLDEDF